MSETTRYLLIFDHAAGALVAEPEAFIGDVQAAAALDAYDRAEEHYAEERGRIEVLLVGAASLDAVRATHGRFFTTPVAAG
jgi:hypothetical protein